MGNQAASSELSVLIEDKVAGKRRVPAAMLLKLRNSRTGCGSCRVVQHHISLIGFTIAVPSGMAERLNGQRDYGSTEKDTDTVIKGQQTQDSLENTQHCDGGGGCLRDNLQPDPACHYT